LPTASVAECLPKGVALAQRYDRVTVNGWEQNFPFFKTSVWKEPSKTQIRLFLVEITKTDDFHIISLENSKSMKEKSVFCSAISTRLSWRKENIVPIL